MNRYLVTANKMPPIPTNRPFRDSDLERIYFKEAFKTRKEAELWCIELGHDAYQRILLQDVVTKVITTYNSIDGFCS